VTAVALFRHFVFAGEGPFLRIYDISHNDVPILEERCFDEHSIHGVSVLELDDDQLFVLLRGGHYARVLLWNIDGTLQSAIKKICSTYLPCKDWILHASFAPQSSSAGGCVKAALITAHNSLVELTISVNYAAPMRVSGEGISTLQLSKADLSASTRCTLYTAHVHWLSGEHILVASGTAFGEIIIWSCVIDRTTKSPTAPRINVHHVFTAHEGSIFGLDILHVASVGSSEPRLLVASCSDDRTIRIWDASHALRPMNTDSAETFPVPTGVSNEGADSVYPVPGRYAQGWAHTSRIWHVAFLPCAERTPLKDSIQLVSIGEDATYQHWRLEESVDASSTSASLKHVETFSNHVGKNIWSYGLFRDNDGCVQLVTGGADGTIAVSGLQRKPNDSHVGSSARYEWQFDSLGLLTSDDESSLQHPEKEPEKSVLPKLKDEEPPSSETKAEVKKKDKSFVAKRPKNGFKTYGFIGPQTLILSTQRGEVLLGVIDGWKTQEDHHTPIDEDGAIHWRLLYRYNNLIGYSVIQCLPEFGLAFFTGTAGTIYSYNHSLSMVTNVCQVEGRVGSFFALKLVSLSEEKSSQSSPLEILLVVTRLGQSIAHVFQWTVKEENALAACYTKYDICIPKNFITTTACIVRTVNTGMVLFLGSREGEIAQFSSLESGRVAEADQQWSCHSDTITSSRWVESELHTESKGYLVTTGRDFSYAITQIDMANASREQISRLSLLFGPYVEGLDVRSFDQHIIFHGFQSRYFVVYDGTAQCELLRVDCGGAHRSWSFHLSHGPDDPIVGTFVWTQASKLCKYSALRHVQTIVKRGGHGREIKACAVSHLTDVDLCLIATGAEDTDIRLFGYRSNPAGTHSSLEYSGLECLSVIRKHNTGLQGLQWSTNGRYLFSCAGCEEFYVWKVSAAPLAKIGVVCLGAMPTDAIAGQVPEQRITSFEAIEIPSSTDMVVFMVSLVLSDSTLRVRYICRPFMLCPS